MLFIVIKVPVLVNTNNLLCVHPYYQLFLLKLIHKLNSLLMKLQLFLKTEFKIDIKFLKIIDFNKS